MEGRAYTSKETQEADTWWNHTGILEWPENRVTGGVIEMKLEGQEEAERALLAPWRDGPKGTRS